MRGFWTAQGATRGLAKGASKAGSGPMCGTHWLAGHVYMPENQRPWAGIAPPSAVYRFAPDWKEEHVLSHLANARGILQADSYKGYAKLYQPEPDGVLRLREAACWAHLRRARHCPRTNGGKWLAPRLLGIDQVRDSSRGARPDRQALRH